MAIVKIIKNILMDADTVKDCNYNGIATIFYVDKKQGQLCENSLRATITKISFKFPARLSVRLDGSLLFIKGNVINKLQSKILSQSQYI